MTAKMNGSKQTPSTEGLIMLLPFFGAKHSPDATFKASSVTTEQPCCSWVLLQQPCFSKYVLPPITAAASYVKVVCWWVGIATRLHHTYCIATPPCMKHLATQHPRSCQPCHSTLQYRRTVHNSPQCRPICRGWDWALSHCWETER